MSRQTRFSLVNTLRNSPRKKIVITPVSKVHSTKVVARGDNSPDSTILHDHEKNANTKKSAPILRTNSNNEANIKQISISECSSVSMDSIEGKLAQMISPSKSVVSKCNEMSGAILSEILTSPNVVGTTMEKENIGTELPSLASSVDLNKKNQMPDISSTAPDVMNVAPTESIGSMTTEIVSNQQDVQSTPVLAVPSSSSGLSVPDIGATEIFGASENINLDDYTKYLDPSSLGDIGKFLEPENNNKQTIGKNKFKGKRLHIIINDYMEENGNILSNFKVDNDFDSSDDDFEEDIPCGMDALTLPNSNTDRNAVEKLQSNCSLCTYKAAKGGKQLTKHYVRKHPDKEISISRLAKAYNPLAPMIPIQPMITHGIGGTMIRSLCYICNEVYEMCSSKWLKHFIAHTGDFEYRCKKCLKPIPQDLHKKCNSIDNIRINGPYVFIDNQLFGFACVKCNYVQLNRENVTSHLENEHQQLPTEEHISEIVLLKISQQDILMDDKNNRSLIEAKARQSVIQKAGKNESDSDASHEFSDNEEKKVCTIDLTLGDDDD